MTLKDSGFVFFHWLDAFKFMEDGKFHYKKVVLFGFDLHILIVLKYFGGRGIYFSYYHILSVKIELLKSNRIGQTA